MIVAGALAVGARARDGARRARRRARRSGASSTCAGSPARRRGARSCSAARSRFAAATSTRSRTSSARRPADADAADEGADLRAPHAPRVDRLADLEGPSGRRRRLGGLGGAGELRALPARRAPPLPGRVAARVPVAPRPTGATACRTRGCRRSRISASIGFVLWVARLRERRLARGAQRRRRPAIYALMATALLAWLWTAQGYVAGIPLDALHLAHVRARGDETATRMSARLHPSRTSVQYAVRKPLLDWLRAQDVRGLRVLDVGCGDRPYERLLARRRGDRRLRRPRKPACRPARLDRRDPGRGRELRRRALPAGARARAGPGGGGTGAPPRRQARRPRARLDARRLSVSPESRATSGAGRTPGSRISSEQMPNGRPLPSAPVQEPQRPSPCS